MPAKRKKTVLIIDDSEYMRSLIRHIMSKHGFRVVGEAENAKIGVEKYKTLKPDIVTSDIIMDEECGISALDQILQYDHDAKVVMISSMLGQKAFAMQAKSKGASAVIVKPIDEKVFIDTLRSIMPLES